MSGLTYPPTSEIFSANPNDCCKCDPNTCNCSKKSPPRRQFTISLDHGFTSQDQDIAVNFINYYAGTSIHDEDIICATPEIYNSYRGKGCGDKTDYYSREFKESELYVSEQMGIVITSYSPTNEIPLYPIFQNPVTKNVFYKVNATQNGAPFLDLYYAPFVVKMPYRVTNSTDLTTPNGSGVIFVEHRYLMVGGAGGSIIPPFFPIGFIGYYNYGFMQFYKEKKDGKSHECNYYKYYKYKYDFPQTQYSFVNYISDKSNMYLSSTISAKITNYNFNTESSDNIFNGSFKAVEKNTFNLNYDPTLKGTNQAYSFGTFLFRYEGTIIYDCALKSLEDYLECKNIKYTEEYTEDTGYKPVSQNMLRVII